MLLALKRRGDRFNQSLVYAEGTQDYSSKARYYRL